MEHRIGAILFESFARDTLLNLQYPPSFSFPSPVGMAGSLGFGLRVLRYSVKSELCCITMMNGWMDDNGIDILINPLLLFQRL